MGILSKRALGRRSRLVTIAALIAGMMLIAGVASAMINDIDDINVEVPDRTTSASATMTNAIVWYYGDQDTTHGSAGTGVFESFVRLQAKGTESGYNTDGALELDTKAGKWTHSIKVSEIPTVEIEERLYWEFFADINEDNKKPKISLNEFELWVTGDPNLTGYEFGSNATQIYDFTGTIKINDVNQGSGRGDLRYLVAQDDYDVGDCTYGSQTCETYLVLFSEWGTTGGAYATDGGFEEWKVKKYPILQVSKTVLGEFDTPVSWEIDKEFDDTYDKFIGDAASTHGYEVKVDQTLGDAENTRIYGTITILGDDKDDVNAEILDVFDGIPATILGCSVAENEDGTYTINNDAVVTCDYTLPLDAPVAGENVASARYTLDDEVMLVFYGTDDIAVEDYVETFTGDPLTVNVTDTNGMAWVASDDATWTYNKDFVCSTNPDDYTDGFYTYDHVNTATITETGQSDDATVTVNCYLPLIDKTVEGATYEQFREWEITKTVDPTSQWGFAGDLLDWEWTVFADETTSIIADSYYVYGIINVYNPASMPMTVDVTDFLDDGTQGVVDCGSGATSVTVAAAVGSTPGSATCTYDAFNATPDATSNTATAMLNGIAFDSVAVDVNFMLGNIVHEYADVTDVQIGVDATVNVDTTWTGPGSHSCSSNPEAYLSGGTYGDQVDNRADLVSGLFTDFAEASTTYDCYAPVVSKDAAGSYDEFHTWDIEKSVDPDDQWGFAGDLLEWTWTVGLSEELSEDNFAVTGSIAVFNPAPGAMTVALADVLNDAAETPGVISTCAGGTYLAGDLTVPAGGTATCGYDAAPGDRTATLNSATATLNTINFIGTADVLFDVTVYDESALVDDDQDLQLPETVNAGEGTWEWTEAYDHTCSSDFADYGADGMYTATIDNLATVTGSDGDYDEAFASTTYTCYAPVVSKDADTEWFRAYSWEIDKEYDGYYELLAGESVIHGYMVSVIQTIDEYGHRAFGTISVSNSAPDEMTVTLTDMLSDGTVADITGCTGTDVVFVDPTLTIPAGGTAECAYTAGLADETDLTNTATATLNEIGFTGTALADFGAPTIVGYPEVDVVDTNGPFWHTASSATWTYDKEFVCPIDKSFYTDGVYTITHVNVAEITQTGEWDDATVTVICEYPWEGKTPGYWKNHLEDWQVYSPDDLVSSVFDTTGYDSLGSATLLEALRWPGGDEVADKAQLLLHHATAAVLNAAHSNIMYPKSVGWIVTEVNAALATFDPNVMIALKDELDYWNNIGADLSS